MTIYYVKSIGGSNGNDGLTPANSWKTVQYADTQISAGDTIWLSPGVHHYDNPWELATTGTSVNPIMWKGDFAGGTFSMTRGEVILMPKTYANDDDEGFIYQILRNFMYRRDVIMSSGNDEGMKANGTEWVEFHNIIFGPSQSTESHSWPIAMTNADTPTSEWAAEGWKLIECGTMGNDNHLYAEGYYQFTDKTDGHVADGEGMLIDRCMFPCSVHIECDESAVQECDMKIIMQSSVIFGAGGGFGMYRDFNDTYEVGGFGMYNCTVAYTKGLTTVGVSMSDYRRIHNNHLNGWQTTIGDNIYTDWEGGESKNFLTVPYALNGFEGPGTFCIRQIHLALGGEGDIIHRAIYGWSPWKPWEPINNGGLRTVSTSGFDTFTYPTYDLYGYPINAAEGMGFFMIDQSYEAVSAGSEWADTPDGNEAFDTDYRTESGAGINPSQIQAAGCDISDIVGWPDDMMGVVARLRINGTPASDQVEVWIEYLSEELLDEVVVSTHTEEYEQLFRPAAPAAGWTRDALSKLRAKYTFTVDSSANLWETLVAPHWQGGNAIGAVASPTKMVQEDTIVNTVGGSSGRIDSLGYWQKAMYLVAGTYAFTVYGYFVAEYTGTKPTIELDVPETAQSDTDVMTGAAAQWEQLTVNLILAEAATVVLRLHSYNTAESGYCYFDDLETA